jgi:hypothetical protein
MAGRKFSISTSLTFVMGSAVEAPAARSARGGLVPWKAV